MNFVKHDELFISKTKSLLSKSRRFVLKMMNCAGEKAAGSGGRGPCEAVGADTKRERRRAEQRHGREGGGGAGGTGHAYLDAADGGREDDHGSAAAGCTAVTVGHGGAGEPPGGAAKAGW